MGSDKTDQADHKFSAKGSRTRWRERGVRGELGEDVQSVRPFQAAVRCIRVQTFPSLSHLHSLCKSREAKQIRQRERR